MDSKTAFTVAKLIEAGVGGKGEVVASYASQLASHYKEIGESDIASLFSASAKRVKGKRASVKRAMPVDVESRIPVADELVVEEPVELMLPPNVQALVERWIDCIANADKLAKHGLASPASLLMHGPPGCGKTLLAKSIAQQLKLPLLTARSDSLISSYLGSTSKNVRALFDHATSRRCVLFLDEFDALAKMRDDQRELGELKRVVISLLQNIDAGGADHILIAATNHPHLLDKAVWRRFSYSVEIGLPEIDSRQQMLASFLGNLADKETTSILALVSDGLSGAQLRNVADDAIRTAVLSGNSSIDAATAISMISDIRSECHMPVEDVVRSIKKKFGKQISQKKLGQIFGISQSTIFRILKHE